MLAKWEFKNEKINVKRAYTSARRQFMFYS